MRSPALLGRLYVRRTQIGALRQSQHHHTRIRALQAALAAVGVTHPYELPRKHYQALHASGEFTKVLEGFPVSPGVEYLYRLSATAILVKYTGWIGPPKPRWPIRRIHAHLLHEARHGNWLPLDGYTAGHIVGRRGFTWWSSQSLYLTDYPRASCRAGVPIDKLPAFPVLLRMRAADAEPHNPPRVPTIVDAFDGSVFHPLPDAPEPAAGETISVESPNLAPGCDEYVLGPIPVERVELLPLRRRRVPAGLGLETGSLLWRKLIAYD